MNGRTRTSSEIAADVANALDGRHRDWLQNFADEHEISYKNMMSQAADFLRTGEEGFLGTDINYEAFPEFWDHYEAVMSVKVPEGKRENFFRCAC